MGIFHFVKTRILLILFCLSTCKDYNPTGVAHDLPPNPVRHIGDMGNITSDGNGTAIVTKFGSDILWALNGNFSIMGRILHVHERRDNGSQPTGDAGLRVAQCVVGARYNTIPNLNTARNENNYTAPATLQNNYGFATCELRPRLNTYPYQGRVTFEKLAGSSLIRVRARICNLTANAALGIHVHEFGDLSEIANTTGDHYNPFNQPHGYPTSPNRHVGDMGNFTVDSVGIANLDFTIDLIQLSGLQSIIGRGVVVHGSNDKGSQPLGAAGERIAACVIGVSTTLIDVSDACVFPVIPTPVPTPKVTPKPSTKVNSATAMYSASSLVLAVIAMLLSMML